MGSWLSRRSAAVHPKPNILATDGSREVEVGKQRSIYSIGPSSAIYLQTSGEVGLRSGVEGGIREVGRGAADKRSRLVGETEASEKKQITHIEYWEILISRFLTSGKDYVEVELMTFALRTGFII